MGQQLEAGTPGTVLGFNSDGTLIGLEVPSLAGDGTGVQLATLADIGGGGGGGTVTGSTVTPEQFGAIGDGVTDDGPAFAAALAYLKDHAANDAGIYKGSRRLSCGPKHYYLGATTLDITHTLIVEGEGTGLAGGACTKLRWAANTTGIRVQRYNTSGAATVDGATHYGGDGTVLRGLFLHGGFTTLASEGPYHGVHAKARVRIEDCFAYYWQGNGFNIVGTSGGGALEGNVNQFAVVNSTTWYCQHGCYIDGADSNAGYTSGCDFSYSRQWGLWDSSFVGNPHYSHHTTNNGFADNGLAGPPYLPPTVVSHGGYRYAVIVGQESWCSTNAPTGAATSNQGWLFCGTGGVLGASIPAWSNGATYRSGGCYMVGEPNPADDGNQNVVITGCYAEGGQGPIQVAGATLVVGGNWGPGLGDHGGYIYGSDTAVGVRKDLLVGRSIFANGGQHYLGSTITPSANINVHLQNTGSSGTFLNFETWDGAGAQLYDDGYILGEPGIGLVFNGRSSSNALRFRAAGANVATIKSTGLDLASGKVLLVNGTQVVGAQGAAVADATDAASTTARLNDLLARLRLHGLIAP